MKPARPAGRPAGYGGGAGGGGDERRGGGDGAYRAPRGDREYRRRDGAEESKEGAGAEYRPVSLGIIMKLGKVLMDYSASVVSAAAPVLPLRNLLKQLSNR